MNKSILILGLIFSFSAQAQEVDIEAEVPATATPKMILQFEQDYNSTIAKLPYRYDDQEKLELIKVLNHFEYISTTSEEKVDIDNPEAFSDFVDRKIKGIKKKAPEPKIDTPIKRAPTPEIKENILNSAPQQTPEAPKKSFFGRDRKK